MGAQAALQGAPVGKGQKAGHWHRVGTREEQEPVKQVTGDRKSQNEPRLQKREKENHEKRQKGDFEVPSSGSVLLEK